MLQNIHHRFVRDNVHNEPAKVGGGSLLPSPYTNPSNAERGGVRPFRIVVYPSLTIRLWFRIDRDRIGAKKDVVSYRHVFCWPSHSFVEHSSEPAAFCKKITGRLGSGLLRTFLVLEVSRIIWEPERRLLVWCRRTALRTWCPWLQV